MAIEVAKVRVELVKEHSVYSGIRELSSPQLAAQFARSLYYEKNGAELRCPSKEIIIVCNVDTQNKPLYVNYASVGTSDSALAEPKEIFISAILCNADAIFVFHNHPSGSHKVSFADYLVTKHLEDAGKILGIPVRDHIIIGDDGYYSCAEKKEFLWEDMENETAG